MIEDQQVQRFTQVVKDLSEPLAIFVSQVDPDALGTAFGLRYLIKKIRRAAGVEQYAYPSIVYGGRFEHPQNRAIINKYNLQQYMRPVSSDGPAERAHALVDSSMVEDSRLGLKKPLNPVITIDHHRGGTVQERDGTFVLIEEVGAASTLIVELMQACKLLPLTGDDRFLGPLLALAIHTDTKALLGAHKRDRDAYNLAADFVSTEELAPLIHYKLPMSYFEYFERAIRKKVQKGSRLVTGLGFIQPSDGDDIAMIADQFVSMEGVSIAIVWGIIGNKVRVSARCTDISFPLDEFLKKRLGNKCGTKLTPDGRGEGGGMLELDLGLWMIPGTRDKVLDLVEDWFVEVFIKSEM